jgi:hypothetical protein
MSPRPTALLLDDGELEDVDLLLRELDADRVRLGADDRPDPWPWPASLLVATRRRALSLDPPAAEQRDYATIVVTDDDAMPSDEAPGAIDFDYLVRRPVHPEALRLLVLRALYRGHEQRAQPRLPVGSRVTWISGCRPGRATLLEISQGGCRLLATRDVAPGTRVALHVPRDLVGGVGLVLRGQVVRAHEGPSGDTSEATILAVEFETPGFLARNRIDSLLRELEIGPAVFRDGEIPAGRTVAPPAPPTAVPQSNPTPVQAAPAAEPSRSDPVHRHQRRAPIQWEVLSVDERAERVIHVFMGRDLSTGGLRVEAHPALAMGDALRLAIYCAAGSDPLIVDAQVVRDDGDAGFGLRFMDVDPAVTQKLDAIVTSASTEVVETGDPEPRSVLVAEILSEVSGHYELSPASRIHVVKPAPEGPLPMLDMLQAAVLDLALVGCTVQRVFDVVPESPIDIVRALEALLEHERIRIER